MDDSHEQSSNPNVTPPSFNNAGQQFQPDNLPIKTRKSKKKIILILLLAILVATGLVSIYLSTNKEHPTAPNPSVTHEQKKQIEPESTGPISLIYNEIGDTNASNYSLKLSSLKLDSDEKSIFDTKDNNSQFGILESTIYGSQIAIIARPTPNGQKTDKIYYSKDNGLSYELIYSTKTTDSITDLKFSSDGSVIIFGVYHNTADVISNTITEIDPKTRTVTDLFISDSGGILFIGYNKGQQIIYHKSCFYCDGATGGDVYSYNVNTNKETKIVAAEGLIEKVIINKDFSKLLYVDSSQRETEESGFPESAGPYKLKSFTLKTSESKEIQTFGETDKHINAKLGYTSKGSPYYSDGKNIFEINSEDKPTTLFESTKNIYDIYYVSPDSIYLSVGTYDAFSINKFTIKDQQSTNLLNGDQYTTIIGVTHKD